MLKELCIEVVGIRNVAVPTVSYFASVIFMPQYILSRRFHCGHRKKQNLALVVKKLVSVFNVVRFSETAKIVISSPNYLRLKKMWMMMKKNFNLFGMQ